MKNFSNSKYDKIALVILTIIISGKFNIIKFPTIKFNPYGYPIFGYSFTIDNNTYFNLSVFSFFK